MKGANVTCQTHASYYYTHTHSSGNRSPEAARLCIPAASAALPTRSKGYKRVRRD
jgi:hypothetical protein